MPFLLIDDAADEASRRLQQFGTDQLGGLRQGAQDIGASAQDVTQRLMQFGQGQLSSLQQQTSQIQPPQPDLDAITGRLHAFGEQTLQDAQNALAQPVQAAQQGVQQLQPLQSLTPAQPPQQPQPMQQAPQPGGDLQSYARQVAQQAGIDPDIFFRQIQQESGFNPTAKSPAGAIGIAQFMPETARGLGLDPTDPYASLAAAAQEDARKLAQYGGSWAKTLAAYNAGPGAVEQYGGVPPFKETQNYVNTILQGAKDVVSQGAQAVQGAVQGVTNKLPSVSQFGDQALSSAEAYAACGPAAALRFAQMFGRNPTLREATDLAAQVGWTAQNGMAGLSSESNLFDKMQIPHRTVGADWNALAKEASSGNPVVISTPGHYFTADAYDPGTGAFHVGSSGTDLRGGSEWMTPDQMQARMGNLQGGLAVDNPGVRSPSPLSAPTNAFDKAKQVAQQGISALDQNVLPSAADQVSGLAQRFGQNLTGGRPIDPNRPATSAVANSLDQLASTVEPSGGGLAAPELLRAGAGLLRQPSVLDSLKLVTDLETKYGNRDTNTWSPEDKQAYGQALMSAGGIVGGTGTTRMFHGTAADFPRVSPSAIGGEENLFGPGYYLTSDPRVAGGMVAQGGEPIPGAPRVFSSASQRGPNGELLPINPQGYEPGAVMAPGYAQQRGSLGLDANSRAMLQDNITEGKRLIASGEVSSPEDVASLRETITDLQDQLDSQVAGIGANVRAVDVPQDLNLFDIDHYVPPDRLEAIRSAVPEGAQRAFFDRQIGRAFEGRPTGEQVYNALNQSFGNTTGSRTAVNQLLGDVGYDGIQYAGGNRIPMADAAGRAIQHQATVIFPDALEQVRNAISGRMGGQARPEFAMGVAGGAASLGALGLGITNPSSNRILDTLQPGLDAAGNFLSPFTSGDVGQRAQDLASYLSSPQSVTDLTQQGPMAAFRQNLAEMGQGLTGGRTLDIQRDPTRQLTEARQALGQALENAPTGDIPLLSGVAGAGGQLLGGFLRQPGVLDSLQTMTELEQKYGTRDASAFSDEDRKAYQQALVAVGGMVGNVSQADLSAIRSSAMPAGPGVPTPRGPIATAVDLTKQGMLSNPATHVANTIGNTLELLRSPIALTLGGRPQDALAGVLAVTRGMPEAVSASLQTMRGRAPATLGGPAQTTRWWEPVYRALGAADQFTRTLGEYQGMAEQASGLLRKAKIDPADPAATAFLQAHAAEIAAAGQKAGGNTVFQMQRTASGGLGFLDNLFNNFSHYKEGLLNSPSLKDQAWGALLDTQIPFSGVPSRMLQIGVGRLPGVGTTTAAFKAVQAARAGNTLEMQRQIGNAVMETAFAYLIIKNVQDGNIRGPDDPDHPGEVRVLGNWVNGGLLGAYALPAMITAAAAEGYQKPLTTPPSDAQSALMSRFGDALSSSFKPFLQAVPGMQMVHFLSSLGQGPGPALQGELQDTINRITAPGAAKFVEDLTDPTQRDVSKGLAGLWETPMARWPGLAEMLPAKIDPTTGQPQEKRRYGPGVLIGADSDQESAIREEANRLSKLGYATKPPTTYPDQVTVGNAVINLKPDEQRAVAEITGQRLGNFADRLDQPSYQNADDNTKARMMQAYLNAADKARASAALQVLGRAELVSRERAGGRVAGRLTNQGPDITELIPSLEDIGKRAAA